MSANALAQLATQFPPPLFSNRGEVANVTLTGTTYTFFSPPLPLPVHRDLEEFAPFRHLPLEIQTKIWGFCLDGRVITGVENPKPVIATSEMVMGGDQEEKTDPEDSFHFIGARYPRIFQVCKQLKRLAGGLGYRPLFEVKGLSAKKVFFNPAIDTLLLDTAVIRVALQKQIRLSDALVRPMDLAIIKNVRIDLAAFKDHFDDTIDDIAAMVSIKNLTFFSTIGVFFFQPGLTLKLGYHFDGVSAVPFACTPNAIVAGKEHVDRIVNAWVPDPQHQEYMKDINNRITLSMRNDEEFPSCDNFPKTVRLECEFVPKLDNFEVEDELYVEAFEALKVQADD